MATKTDARHEKGRWAEQVAVDFLDRRGLTVVARNFRCTLGEIDVVARDGKTVVFVEVKFRRDVSRGLPQEAVSASKHRRLTLLAQWYLKKHRLEGQPARFDIVAVTMEEGEPRIRWIANAFEARE